MGGLERYQWVRKNGVMGYQRKIFYTGRGQWGTAVGQWYRRRDLKKSGRLQRSKKTTYTKTGFWQAM